MELVLDSIYFIGLISYIRYAFIYFLGVIGPINDSSL